MLDLEQFQPKIVTAAAIRRIGICRVSYAEFMRTKDSAEAPTVSADMAAALERSIWK